MKNPEIGKIVRMTIPDNDMPGWIETLRRGGLNDAEIDEILGNLNFEYAKASGGVDKIMNEVTTHLRDHHKVELSDSDTVKLRADIEKYLESKFT